VNVGLVAAADARSVRQPRSSRAMKIRTIAARWSLDLFHGEDLPTVAAILLQAGHDNQRFREVAGMSRPTLRDAGEIFSRGMAEAGFEPLDRRKAVQLLAWDVAKGIVDGEIRPESGARQLAGLWSGSPGIEELVAFYGCTDQYDENPEARLEIDDEIRVLAGNFVAAHPELAA
jgi:hypothetical protein